MFGNITSKAIVLLFIVLIIDLLVPLGVAIGVLYITCIVLLIKEPPAHIVLFSLLTSVLIIGVVIITNTPETSWMAYVNRGISVLAVGIVCFISIQYKKLDDMREAYIAQLEKKSKEQEQFIYIASHDLQEPLRTVHNYAGLIQKRYTQHFDTLGKKSLSFILEATNRMSQLIKGLLDYSRVKRQSHKEQIDCNQLLKEIIEDLDTIIEETQSCFQISSLPTVYGYRTGLRILFQNLILNAIKFRRENTRPYIIIDAQPNENAWAFSIQDNGIGIHEKYHQKIFLMFQQLNDKATYEGSGIGLAQCQKVIDIHNGQIWVNSQLNVGSTFYFTIPKTRI